MTDKKTTTTTPKLTAEEQAAVETAFKQANDFRSIGERITAPIDSIIEETSIIISKDPILNVSDELQAMNKKMQGVYDDIIDDDGIVMKFFKAIPLLGFIAEKVDDAIDDAGFNIQDINGKVATIFNGFDQSYQSLGVSIDMQKNFLKGIDENLGLIIAYKNFLSVKIEEFQKIVADTTDEKDKVKFGMFLRSVEFFQSNLIVLIGNLEMAEKRLLIRLDSAQKLSLAMNSSKPIFKTLLSSAVIEVAGQKAIDASMIAMKSMGETIDKLSSDLTDKAIEGNRRAEELSSKPVLSSSVFIENIAKLQNHFAEIDAYRAQVAIEAKAENVAFDKARKNLLTLKTISAQSQDELSEILMDGAPV